VAGIVSAKTPQQQIRSQQVLLITSEKLMRKKDPPCVVIDEVCGMLLGLLFVPYDIKLVIIAFLIFRILDTLKPFPVGRLERLKGSLGIMTDDLVAGLYTNIILQAVVILTSFFPPK